jgi:hypothetical protein
MSKCPVCGEWAYLGFSSVECSNESCKFFTDRAKADKHTASIESEHCNRAGDFFNAEELQALPAAPQASPVPSPDAIQDAPGQTMMDFGDPPDDSHLNLEYDMDMP